MLHPAICIAIHFNCNSRQKPANKYLQRISIVTRYQPLPNSHSTSTLINSYEPIAPITPSCNHSRSSGSKHPVNVLASVKM
ncbi:hypothetical protein T4D_8725 [Trichinella pseudospiralis]|uniref:Uncharacterized protein n=1 Tax=Trichinella pseudospiralis TaxID=6337 RepID=A0A0V1G343_TRIPS|nr:hypothetical protein T4D_8725 [Trichinella pseudospiralis]